MGEINFIKSISSHGKSLKPFFSSQYSFWCLHLLLHIFSLAKKNSVRRYYGCVKIKLIKATGITASFYLTLMSHYILNTLA